MKNLLTASVLLVTAFGVEVCEADIITIGEDVVSNEGVFGDYASLLTFNVEYIKDGKYTNTHLVSEFLKRMQPNTTGDNQNNNGYGHLIFKQESTGDIFRGSSRITGSEGMESIHGVLRGLETR